MLEVKELKCKHLIVEKYSRANIMLIRSSTRINSTSAPSPFSRIRGKEQPSSRMVRGSPGGKESGRSIGKVDTNEMVNNNRYNSDWSVNTC